MDGLQQVKSLLEQQGTAFDAFVRRSNESLAEYRERIEMLEAKAKTPGTGATMSADRKEFAATLKGAPATETKGHSIGSDPDGGVTVPALIAGEIFDQALRASAVGSLVTTSPSSSSDYARLVNLRGQAASWSSETGTRSETDTAQFRERKPTHGELYSVVPVTNWLLNDSKFDLASFVMQQARTQFSKAIANAIILGNGTNQPTGILNTTPVSTADEASPARAASAIQYVSGTDADALIDAYFALAPEYRQNASWVCNSQTLAAVRKLKSDDQYLFTQTGRLVEGVDAADGLLLGKPVVTCEEITGVWAASPAVDCIIVGDWRVGYELVRIGEMTVLRDPYTSRGKTLFYISQRVGGCVMANDALKSVRA